MESHLPMLGTISMQIIQRTVRSVQPRITEAKPKISMPEKMVPRKRAEERVAATGSMLESMLAFLAPQRATPDR